MQVSKLVALGAIGLIAAGGPALAKEAGLKAFGGEFSASEEQFITVVSTPEGLRVLGNASYGALDPERAERGAVNVGEFDATVPWDWIEDGALGFAVGVDAILPVAEADEYDCVVEMQFSDDRATIEVSDNLMCGGMNVTFTGTYTRIDAASEAGGT